jgi:hypothetical protein
MSEEDLSLRARLWRVGGSTLGNGHSPTGRMCACSLNFVTEVLAGSEPGSMWGGSGVQWPGQVQSESVHVGWEPYGAPGPHVAAFSCRHDGTRRGSERFFHLSPTEEAYRRRAVPLGTRDAEAAVRDQAPRPRSGFRVVTPYARLSSGPIQCTWSGAVWGGAAVLHASGAS